MTAFNRSHMSPALENGQALTQIEHPKYCSKYSKHSCCLMLVTLPVSWANILR